MRTGTAGVTPCQNDREIFGVDINDSQNFERAVESGRNRSGCRHKLAVFRSKGPIITRCPLTQDGEAIVRTLPFAAVRGRDRSWVTATLPPIGL